ncbi:MAG: hypothetical protein IT302_07585 [Dehalococcoidia bacterium]|nr:hypothetical protein [Dehalococcoidia bacterium]
MKASLASAIVLLIGAFVTRCGDEHPGEKWPGPAILLSPAPFISAGWDHACAIRGNGTLACWGSNEELDCPPWSGSPCFTHYWGQAVAPEGWFVALDAGTFHTCGVREDGTLACWGANESFSCVPFGPCTVFDGGQSTPPAGAFRSVSAGYTHSCGVEAAGTIRCWGANEHGQSSPPAGQFQAVAAGTSHTCALRLSGELTCWGLNWSGQTDAPAGVFASISAGGSFNCGLRPDGHLECWGSNTSGQTESPAGVFRMVAAGSDHACGIRPDDTVECWGFNHTSGSVVNGHFLSEGRIPPGPFVTISAGFARTCGIRRDGTAACWGAWAGASDAPPGPFKTE